MTEDTRIIRRTPLKPIDFGLILFHLLISFGIWISNEHQYFNQVTLRIFVHGYYLVLPITLVGLFYGRLRNINFYTIWLIIGIIQFVVYPELVDLPQFQFLRGSAFSGLRALLPTIVMYQILRIIFISTHNKEMIISIRQYQFSRWDDDEQRNITWIEVGFSLTLLATALISNGMS